MNKYIKMIVFPGIFSGLYLGLVLLFSVMAYYFDFAMESLSLISYVLMIVVILMCAVFCAKKAQSKGWLIGLLSGGGVILIVALVSFILNGSLDTASLMGKLPLYIFISLIGGIIGINLKKQ